MPTIQRKVFDRYLTEADEKQLFKTIDSFAGIESRRDAAWMRLLRQTGIRVGTLAGLTAGDGREALRTGRLHLRAEIMKRGTEHEIHLNKAAQKALKSLLSIRGEQGHAAIAEDPLIMSRNHRGMSVRSFQARMSQWCAAAGLEDKASPHWFRHTLAKRVMARSTARNPLEIVKHVLGHASLDSTVLYASPDKETVRQALEEAA